MSGQTAFVPDSRTRKKKAPSTLLDNTGSFVTLLGVWDHHHFPNCTDWQLMSWSKDGNRGSLNSAPEIFFWPFPLPPLERETGRGEPDGRFVCLFDNGRLLWKFLGIFNIGYICWRRKRKATDFYRKRPKTHWMVRTASVYLRFLAKAFLLSSFFNAHPRAGFSSLAWRVLCGMFDFGGFVHLGRKRGGNSLWR